MSMKKGKISLALLLSPKIRKRKLLKELKKNQKEIKSNELSTFYGKRVVLIGPSYDNGVIEDFSAFDLVARIGYTGRNSIFKNDKDICNVSFLANWHAKELAENISKLKPELDGVTFYMRNDVTKIDKIRLLREFKCMDFSITEINKIFGRVVPNFGVQIIYFLLSQNPKEILISNMDLNTSLLRPIYYATNKILIRRKNQAEHLQETIKNSLITHHNPFTNFSFFNVIKNLKVVKFSTKLDYLIANGINEYKNIINGLYFK